MMRHRTHKLLAFVLALALMGAGVPAAVSAAAETGNTVERLVERWSGDRLADLRQSGESYTTETVGVREPASTSRGDWYWIMHVKPTSSRPDGSLIFRSGSSMKVVARYNTDGTYMGGTFDFIDATNCGGPSMEITQELLEAAPVKTDPVFGYRYREVTLEMGRLSQDIDQMNIHIGTPSLAGRHTVELYGLSVYVDDVLVWECDGEALSQAEQGSITRVNIPNATGEATGIVSRHSEAPTGEARTLAELETPTLKPGSYTAELSVKTHGDSNDKLRVSVSTPTGVLQTYEYNRAQVLSRLLGETTGRYDTLRIDFALPQGSDEQKISVKIEAFDGADVYLRSVTLYEFTTEERVEADQIVSAIASIGTLTPDNFLDKIDLIEKTEAAYAAYVERFGQPAADANIPNAADLKQAREDYNTLTENAGEEVLKRQLIRSAEEAINALIPFGPYSYRAGKQTVEAAEAAVSRLTDQYGDEAAALVSNLGSLTAARERLNYLLRYTTDRFTETEGKLWTGADLAAANSGAETYTTETIGVREPASDVRGDWYWLMYLTPPATYNDGSLIFAQGSELSVIVRLSNSDNSYDGSQYFELIDTQGTDGALSHYITREEFEEAPELIDPNFGYSYKELHLTMGTMGQDYDNLQFNIGANTTEGRHTVELYYFGVCVDGQLVWDCEGELLSLAVKGNVERENIENDSGQVTGLHAAAGFGSATAPSTLAGGITAKLDAGVYAFDVELMTTGNSGFDGKARFTALGDNGQTVLSSYDYSKIDVLEAVHLENSGRYDTTRFYVTVDQAHAGQDITLQIESFGSSEIFLRSVRLVSLTSQKLTDARQIVSAIEQIGTVTVENYASKKSLIETAEGLLSAFLGSYGQDEVDELIGDHQQTLKTAREAYDQFAANAQEQQKTADAEALKAAIAAIGEVTQENYSEKLAAIETAEGLRYRFVSAYGEDALGLIDNDAQLLEARSKYNAFKEQEKDIVYGDINNDGDINATDALMALQHSVRLIELDETQSAAADVDGNGGIDAADALCILQYSVQLITRFPVEQ